MGQVKVSPIVQEYILESLENISVISSSISSLEKDPSDKDIVNALYRAVHTIKGGAGFLKFHNMEKLSHNFENVLELVRNGEINLNQSLADLFWSCHDSLNANVQFLESNGKEMDEVDEGLVTKLLGVIEVAKTPDALTLDSFLDENNEGTKKAKLQSVPEKKEELREQPDESKKKQDDLDSMVQKLKAAKRQKPQDAKKEEKPKQELLSDQKATSSPSPKPNAKESSLADSVVRVNVNLLDKIMNVVGELVLTRNQILQFAGSSESPELIKLSNQLNGITTELQEDVMTTRMQPIGSVLSRFERIVRDMARELGKSIELKIEGKATELDKTLLEAIKDPLTHMIRNSVDHGIENPEIRTANGKKETGTLHINAYHEGGQVTIEINDDGGGIAKDRVKSKAIEKGLITQEKADRMSENELLQLIFLPGFSTAAQVTNISGRGVGMDVVRTNIEKIGGKIEVSSEVGKGTSFKLKIPLTLAIIPALIINTAEQSFAIPQVNLLELVRLSKESQEIEWIDSSEFFRLRGDLIPLFRLSDVLNLKTKETKDSDSENIVVLHSDGKTYGLAVDEILDTVEIVVKPLSSHMKNIPLYAGATIMGDGRVSLILDVNGIASQQNLNTTNSKETEEEIENSRNKDAQEMLLFKLESHEKELFAFPLILVNRLEEFSSEDVEFTGTQALIHYRGKPMPLLFVDSELGFAESIEGPESLPKDLHVIVLELRGETCGFVVKEIIDVNTSLEAVNDTVKDRNGIVGTMHMLDQTVSVVDVFSIMENSRLRKSTSTKTSVEEKQTTNEKTKVLVVEDSPMFRSMAVKIVKEAGYEVAEARDGVEALKYLNANDDIDVVLSDIEMPEMSGWQLCEAIRSADNLKNLPVIALTTRFSPQDIEKGKQVGFDYYLEKMKKEDIHIALSKLVQGGV